MSGVAPGWEGSGSVHRPLVAHPWDEIAARIYPGAQTVPEAESILQKKAVDDLVDEVHEHRREARYLLDRVDDEDREGDEARDRLVALVGEAAAKDLIDEDEWHGVGMG